MVTSRIQWADLTREVREAVEANTGPIHNVKSVSEGFNSEIAAVVYTAAETFFVKGLRTDHPRVWTQQVEATINPFVHPVAARLRWEAETGGWNILGFECVEGRHADYTPGSEDLSKIAASLRRLQEIPCPDLPLKRAEQRWSAYADDASAFAGDYLLHTDYNPHNVLVAERVYLVDWAWPTRGAGWIDPACWVIWLIAAGGHTAESAEAWAAKVPSWACAPGEAVSAFATANAALWEEIAQADPDPWTVRMAAASRAWVNYRTN